VKEVQERISTVEDGDGTVNERLSTGGAGPEGQPDTVTERLSGDQHVAVGEPPAQSANKGAWVDYAVSQGAEPDAAEAMTKADLVETYGS
jgi:hypothetical protein